MIAAQPARPGQEHDDDAVQPVLFSHPVAGGPVDYQRLNQPDNEVTNPDFSAPVTARTSAPEEPRTARRPAGSSRTSPRRHPRRS